MEQTAVAEDRRESRFDGIMGDYIDLAGKRFGNLTVINREKLPDKPHVVYWQCRCDCGSVVVLSSKRLRRGSTTSCGCIKSSNRRNYKTTGTIVCKYAPTCFECPLDDCVMQSVGVNATFPPQW